MDKLKMQSVDLTHENIEKIAKLFPNVITERKDENGNFKKAINFELLKQELSEVVVESEKERYQLVWPGKKEAIVTANMPINKTLRPVKNDSVDWDKTQNIYIEGDNLEVLKILQECYLNEIKCIYIDPPYNTGNDFIYRDNYNQEKDEYHEESGQTDEEGNRLVPNPESNGRFHSDWLTMMYSRLKLARNLLSNDGIIFISIDDNEVDNLKKICGEIFGEDNFLGIITWSKKRKGSFLSKKIISLTEYVLVYTKKISDKTYIFGGKADNNESQPIIKRTNSTSILKIKAGWITTKLPDGKYNKGIYGEEVNPVELLDDVVFEKNININDFTIKAPFVWSQSFLEQQVALGTRLIINTSNFQVRVFRTYTADDFKGFPSYIDGVKISGTNEDAYEDLEKIFEVKKLFDYSKPNNYIKELIKGATYFDKECVILDFFSGSATTAHAVMQLNAEDGGNRKYIMVQLSEKCHEESEAYKAGYKNICEIGKERIRRAAKKIKEETKANIDYGFRVFKADSSNMKDIYYSPEHLKQNELDLFESNTKADRNDEDLLIQVLLDFGLKLSLPMETRKIGDQNVHFVAGNSLVACFDENISEDIIKKIAKEKPLRTIFKDNSFKRDDSRINVEEIFKMLSPGTEIKVI